MFMMVDELFIYYTYLWYKQDELVCLRTEQNTHSEDVDRYQH